MLRLGPALVAAVALAGCGEPTLDRDEPLPDAGSRVIRDLRTPDTRSPLTAGDGVWSCRTGGRIELRVSADGLASLSLGGGLLAMVTTRRSLINRSCAPLRPALLPPPRGARIAPGSGRVRCRVPGTVLVDLRDGDLVVRDPGHGRFVAGAAISLAHIDVAAYWRAPCSYAR